MDDLVLLLVDLFARPTSFARPTVSEGWFRSTDLVVMSHTRVPLRHFAYNLHLILIGIISLDKIPIRLYDFHQIGSMQKELLYADLFFAAPPSLHTYSS